MQKEQKQIIDSNGNLVDEQVVKNNITISAMDLEKILSSVNQQQLALFEKLLTQDTQTRERQKQIDVEKELAKRTSARGQASQEFVNKMKQEILDGKFESIYYSPADAKVNGKYLKHNVNGYDIVFRENEYTTVPNSLVNEAKIRLHGLDNIRRSSSSHPNLSVANNGFEIKDPETGKTIGSIPKDQILSLINKKKQSQ